MTIKLTLDTQAINNLDLSIIENKIESWIEDKKLLDYEQQLQFAIAYPREADDPRELSEIPEIRLWYVRLDSVYPWIPFLLDWKTGELARYVAMLVPHQFNRTEGIIFNPEALELFVMNKIFVLSDWLQQQNIPERSRLKSMAKLFGYELDNAFFEMIL
ncbi:CRR6 family NdhI maturation factor [Waterburya agarophytonicola K14]|uniref:CRR6 family NdhI maturation factor n=1 Tax=Waterburya agarophytonicola KI4 TaxID=2874699 RepID=A0A964FGR6_9CYAN|nr:CRR6 family NdhI maturation factor [Waterburya agarophytonicola KI4]